jgi:hypothetical protein
VILSEPPGIGYRLSTSIGNGVIDLDDKDGIAVIPSEPPGLGSCLSASIEDGIGSTPAEQCKKIQGFEIPQGYEDAIRLDKLDGKQRQVAECNQAGDGSTSWAQHLPQQRHRDNSLVHRLQVTVQMIIMNGVLLDAQNGSHGQCGKKISAPVAILFCDPIFRLPFNPLLF